LRKVIVSAMEPQHRKKLNREITGVIRQALRISLYNPPLAWFFLKTLLRQRRAAGKRELWEQEGIHVPPFMIASITRRCNLNCAGCYARALQRSDRPELSVSRLSELMDEARELGFAFALLAGGEPLTRPEILDVTEAHPEIMFPLFTNGTLLTGPILERIAGQKNLIPVLSLEGLEEETDSRRGTGVYEHLLRAVSELKQKRVFFGISLTVTRKNIDLLTSGSFVRQLAHQGCRLFFYVEYIPVKERTEKLVVSAAQREELGRKMGELRRRFNRLFISFPGDEQSYGGCLAAGRGFVHISPEGGLEPCPFAPYSDVNLRITSLKQGLSSVFLNRIRQSDEHLNETEGGCALWNKREWVRSLLVNTSARIA
jgi:MoaA/NifB/PqqE/SkfB family radical SAM enzyme